MPAKSKSQQRFFGVVKGIQKGSGKGRGKAKTAAKDMSSTDVDDFAKTKHKGLPNKVKQETKVRGLIRRMVREIMKEDFAGTYSKEHREKFDKGRQKQSEVLGYKLTGKSDVKTEIDDATVTEAKKRDYKTEYKKYGSSTKSKKYRAELNAYNRKKGTYGNGDGLDASHKGGKIKGFEKESVNRGRAEKSRLKKEGLGSALLPVWKIFIKGYKKPFRVAAMDKRDAKQVAHQMMKNNTIKITKIVKEGKLSEDFGSSMRHMKAYSSPEAKKVVDGALQSYSKDLKKLKYRVIKDWMSKAKSGVIDYFDLVRGFQTGDAKRANPSEVDFLMSVLEKDKIIDRFRKYFGGKKGKTNR